MENPDPVRMYDTENVFIHMRGCDFDLSLTADQVCRIFGIIMEPKRHGFDRFQRRIDDEW